MYYGESIPGFPEHPHTGFETITIVERGYVDHFDSLGNSGRYGAGDVQWLTTGNGVQHCEMFPGVHQDQNNPLELFQIWLNSSPEQRKTSRPIIKCCGVNRFHMYFQPMRPDRSKRISGSFQDSLNRLRHWIGHHIHAAAIQVRINSIFI